MRRRGSVDGEGWGVERGEEDEKRRKERKVEVKDGF